MLVLRPGALGDTLLAVPALRALRRHGFSPLTLAAHAGATRLLASVGEVDRGISFDDAAFGWLYTADRPLDDVVVAWMNAGGVPGLKHARLVAPSRPADDGVHCAQYLLNTLAQLGVEGICDERPLGLSALGWDEVLVHPGSGSAAKNWPAPDFAATIAAVDGPVRLIVGEADTQAAEALESCLGGPLPRLQGAPLEELARRLAGCRAYLGNDSGVSHLAGLSGAHTVVLFGPTPPQVWRPLGPHVRVAHFDTPPDQVAALLEDWR